MFLTIDFLRLPVLFIKVTVMMIDGDFFIGIYIIQLENTNEKDSYHNKTNKLL